MIGRMLSLLVSRRRVSLDGVLAAADAHGPAVAEPFRAHPAAPPRTRFDSDTPGLRPSLTTLGPRDRLRAARRMVPFLGDLARGSRMHDRPVAATARTLTPERLTALERLARGLGARDVAYVRVPDTAVFQGTPIPHDRAIVFSVEMDREPIATMPSFDAQLEVIDGYRRLARIANAVATFLRSEGVSAFPGTALGGTSDYVQLAELAGLGAIGYHGLLITPGEGARVRLGVVYADLDDLPERAENPHTWVRDFCAMCRKCVRSCPVGAIYDVPEAREPNRYQTIDHGRCRDYFLEHFGCGVCLAVCPFSQAGYEAIHERFRGNPGAPIFELAPAVGG
jgi:ferredoxin